MAVANQVATNCWTYAQAYVEMMLVRLAKEEPDYFADKPISQAEFSMHMQSNICLPVTKYKNKVFIDTTAQLTEEGHLKDRIRRLSNDGDKFHPYLWES